MKKIISVILAIAMLVSVTAISITAFGVVDSIESTTKKNPITVEVNGNETNDVTYEEDDDDPSQITFTYTGDGELQGWEFPGMVEGQDYEIISEDGNSITIRIINGYDGPIVANAIVKDTTTGKKGNEKKKSPRTGAGAATAVVAAGVGLAVLALAKKKNEE